MTDTVFFILYFSFVAFNLIRFDYKYHSITYRYVFVQIESESYLNDCDNVMATTKLIFNVNKWKCQLKLVCKMDKTKFGLFAFM